MPNINYNGTANYKIQDDGVFITKFTKSSLWILCSNLGLFVFLFIFLVFAPIFFKKNFWRQKYFIYIKLDIKSLKRHKKNFNYFCDCELPFLLNHKKKLLGFNIRFWSETLKKSFPSTNLIELLVNYFL